MAIKLMVNSACVLIVAFTISNACAADDYGAWARRNPDGSWTRAAEKAVANSTLSSLMPKDIGKFCGKYSDILVNERNKFWAGLLSIMARPESNFNPKTSYLEKFRDSSEHRVISRGLLQLSIESANQDRYNCRIANSEELHDPDINLSCAVKILDYWVAKDGVIATYGGKNSASRGGGRYWSTLRESNNHLGEITGFTRKLSVCQ